MLGAVDKCLPRLACVTGVASHLSNAVNSAVASACLASPLTMKRGLFGQSFEVGEITAFRRDQAGSRHAQWARQNQLIPGIVYGPGPDGRRATEEKIYVRESDLRREVNKRGPCFTNTLFDMCVHASLVMNHSCETWLTSTGTHHPACHSLGLQSNRPVRLSICCCRVLDGKKYRVLPRDFAVHPFKPKALCINWLRYNAGSYPGVRIDIPLKGFNQERCPAYKEGGWLMELRYKVRGYERVTSGLERKTSGARSALRACRRGKVPQPHAPHHTLRPHRVLVLFRAHRPAASRAGVGPRDPRLLDDGPARHAAGRKGHGVAGGAQRGARARESQGRLLSTRHA